MYIMYNSTRNTIGKHDRNMYMSRMYEVGRQLYVPDLFGVVKKHAE